MRSGGMSESSRLFVRVVSRAGLDELDSALLKLASSEASCVSLAKFVADRVAYLADSYPEAAKRSAASFCELDALHNHLRASHGQVARSFVHEFDVLLPVALVRVVAKEVFDLSLRSLLQVREGEMQCRFALLYSPCVAPVNPNRMEMLRRTRQCELIGQDAAYADMVANVCTTSLDNPHEHHFGGKMGEATSRDDGKGHETMASFMKEISIGLDMRLMSFAGAIFGYYVCWARGQAKEHCIVGAAVGAIVMLFVDGILLILRVSKEDEKTRAAKKGQQKRLKAAATSGGSRKRVAPPSSLMTSGKKDQ